MRALVLTPNRNHNRSDYTGAFAPESKRFCELWDIPHARYAIDIGPSYSLRRKETFRCIEDAVTRQDGELELLAVFCHGWVNGLQVGWLRQNLREVAAFLSDYVTPDVRIPLYCCLAGGTDTRGVGGDGGFADRLRDALCERGITECQVDAHTTSGHTTWNPYVLRFSGEGSPTGGQGGHWLVAPKGKLWRPWVQRLKTTDLRLRFPWMTVAEIHEELSAALVA
jgi:hypothetical protein